MSYFRYGLCAPIRLLLPFALALLVLPGIFRDELMNYIAIPIFYFFGTYFIFLNFPGIAELLHSRPLYLEDLIIANHQNHPVSDQTFKHIYSVIMNFILAMLFAIFAEYVIIKGVKHKPVVELMAIIGGNMTLYIKAERIAGKIILSFCHFIKEKEVRKMSFSEFTASPDIELTETISEKNDITDIQV